MPHLIAYGQMSTNKNAIAENLVKAQCDFCGRKFGSIEEAKECEREHFCEALKEELYKEFAERSNG